VRGADPLLRRRTTEAYNRAENCLRPVALGRKNYLFAGSDKGGEHAAAIYTLIQTARLNFVDREAWLRDVLTRVADEHPANRIGELAPWIWSAKPGADQVSAKEMSHLKSRM